MSCYLVHCVDMINHQKWFGKKEKKMGTQSLKVAPQSFKNKAKKHQEYYVYLVQAFIC